MQKRLCKNETDVQHLIRMSLNYWYDGKCFFEKEHGDEYTSRGIADLVGHIQGRYVAIELKMRNNYPSKEQITWNRHVHRTGGVSCYIIYEWDDAKKENIFYFVKGDIDTLSYRQKGQWMKSSVVDVVYKGENFTVVNMMPLGIMLTPTTLFNFRGV